MKVPVFIGSTSLVLFGWLAASYTQEMSLPSYLLDASPAGLEATLGVDADMGDLLTVGE